jgi:hypothetical protein
MARPEHLDQVERWANFVKNNPTKWKAIPTEFINAIFQKHEVFRKRLLQTPGNEKLELLQRHRH